jgi:SAM-dependent methyltransferase
MPDATHYVIRGGLEGRDRLRVLSRVMHPTTSSLFDRVGVASGHCCLDVGCGGGDVTLALGRRVAPHGSAVGVDIDDTKLAIARDEAAQEAAKNVDFRHCDIRVDPIDATFDLVYARFLLTHLSDPSAAVGVFYDHVKPGGTLIVEDIEFSGYFTHPASEAVERYRELYCATVSRRGGDPNIGPRLPSLLLQSGFTNVEVAVVQHVGLTGDAKLLNALTMENIAGAVLADGLATQVEIDAIVRELYDFAADPRTMCGTPRIVQAWGHRPAA